MDHISLCDPATQFMYYSISRDEAPGRGTSEFISDQDLSEDKYKDLKAIAKWRQQLSNFYQTKGDKGGVQAQFTLDGKQWSSVEAYFQGTKFKESHPAYYQKFSLDSGDTIGKSVGNAIKSAGGKTGCKKAGITLTSDQLAKWDSIKFRVIKDAIYAKFSQNESLKKLLLATGNATLTHRPARNPKLTIEYGLMQTRYELRNNLAPEPFPTFMKKVQKISQPPPKPKAEKKEKKTETKEPVLRKSVPKKTVEKKKETQRSAVVPTTRKRKGDESPEPVKKRKIA